MKRQITIETPFGADKLFLRRFSYSESLGRLFQLDAELISKDHQLPFDKIVGEKVTISLEVTGGVRYFHGMVSAFTQTGSKGRMARYQATIVPWMWFLTRTSDCRIFQEKTVPDIIKEIFKEHGFSENVKDELKGTYNPWVYCVQYRETDFNFVSRLMEQEGIYYYWRHAKEKHELVLVDDPTSHTPFAGYKQIKFRTDPEGYAGGEEISEWTIRKEVQPVIYALNDYNFEKPSASLLAKASVSRKHAQAKYEVYDYPGEYDAASEGQAYAKVRIQELQSQHETLVGNSDARGIAAGSVFSLVEHPRKDQNKAYLVTSTNYTVESEEYEAGVKGNLQCSCFFQAIDSQIQFRPPRVTPKPIIQGPQTAVVVGPQGHELYVDDQARVKVQFHWDRYGKKNENSSCWMRVSQPWAGKGYGALNIPRIGCEVIVEFLEGDPDQPIINGRVYNADTLPHGSTAGQQELERVQQKKQQAASQTKQVIAPPSRAGGGGGSAPASGAGPIVTGVLSAVAGAAIAPMLAKLGKSFLKSQANPAQGVVSAAMMTTIKSNSLGGSGGSNEIALNDSPGAETLFIKAERDMIVSVNNDSTTTVDNDMTLDITGDRHTMISGKDTLNVSKESETTIGKRYSLTIAKSAAIKVAKVEQHSVGGNHELTVGRDAKTNIKRDAITNIVGKETHEVAKDFTHRVGENVTIEVLKNRTTTIKGEDKLTVEKTETVEVTDVIKVTGKKAIQVEAGDEITLKCGPASITIKKSGDVEIKGTNVKIEATAQIVSSATATNEIKGAMVKINS